MHEHAAPLRLGNPTTTYHVFLSFRGPDTRDGLAAWLYRELKASGLRTFRDDDEIQRGQNIDREIDNAIRESQVGLIVFSPDFASSPYCLDEVVILMDRNRTKRIAVIPVFFMVDPSAVSDQTGSFGVSFEEHENKLQGLRRRDREKLRRRFDRWREALGQAVELGGLVYKQGPQPEFVNTVVKNVIRHVKYMPFSVSPDVVGRDSESEEITSWIQDGSAYPRIALVYGIGGVGKTAIAKTVFNRNFNKFRRRCFLKNVREVAKQSKGLVCLQKQLLTDIHTGGAHDFHDPEEGTGRIRAAISRKKVFIVLDNVDQPDHLYAIIGGQDLLCPGSKIIVTTRNRGLLESWNKPVLRVGVYPWDDESVSLQLFSWHAFRRPRPGEGYMNLSRRAVRLCCGLPLALKELGSSLFDRSVASWQSTHGALDTIIENVEVKKVLRISYDSLGDDLDKNLFLDVARHSIGMNKDYVQKTLESSQMYRRSGLEQLVNWCLVSIDENNKLVMHPLIRDMARDIIRQESSNRGFRLELKAGKKWLFLLFSVVYLVTTNALSQLVSADAFIGPSLCLGLYAFISCLYVASFSGS